mmetsp:Transcript_20724/g.40019  ORF Transcript_20724/g.40019 Transcript_20724/m.40019 type:complete len:209 (+) Transcript_20724:422-1048(+)
MVRVFDLLSEMVILREGDEGILDAVVVPREPQRLAEHVDRSDAVVPLALDVEAHEVELPVAVDEQTVPQAIDDLEVNPLSLLLHRPLHEAARHVSMGVVEELGLEEQRARFDLALPAWPTDRSEVDGVGDAGVAETHDARAELKREIGSQALLVLDFPYFLIPGALSDDRGKPLVEDDRLPLQDVDLAGPLEGSLVGGSRVSDVEEIG